MAIGLKVKNMKTMVYNVRLSYRPYIQYSQPPKALFVIIVHSRP